MRAPIGKCEFCFDYLDSVDVPDADMVSGTRIKDGEKVYFAAYLCDQCQKDVEWVNGYRLHASIK